jgi:hypothetical protein
MRHPLLLSGVAALVAAPFASASTATPEALRDAVKSAFEARSVSEWKKNIGGTPLNEADILILDQTLTQLFSAKPVVESVEVGELVDGFDPVLVAGGRKYVMTLTPVGVINLKFRIGGKSNSIALPYGKVADGYKLGTLSGEKIVWKGPEDRAFYLAVDHTGAPGDITVIVKYNASGVDLEKRVSGRTSRLVIPAQHIDSVEVVRTGGPGETSLEITSAGVGDANARVKVYASEKLRKAGTITFRRKAPEVGAAK